LVVYLGRSIGKLGERGDGVSNVGAGSDLCVKDFAKKSTIRETHFLGEVGMIGSVFGKSGGGI
jgi:hypothetical protein